MKHEELLTHLNALDAKCAALLQLSGIVLTLGTIPAIAGSLSGYRLVLSGMITLVFMVNCLISLSVLWYVPDPDEALFRRRCRVYKVLVLLSGIGLVLISVLLSISLFIGA